VSNSQAQISPSILVLGAGAVVNELYLPALAKLGLTDRVKVIDCVPEQLAKVGAAWPAIKTEAGDFREVLQSSNVGIGLRAAIVALPNALHTDACLRAIEAGFDVLCDKPLALRAEECRSIYTASTQAGRIVDVNMCRRYLPSMVAMRRALQDGQIGDLLSVEIEDGGPYVWSATTPAPFDRENGGVLADMGVHYIDLIEHLLGRLEARAYRDDFAGGVEANAVLELETGRGILVRIELSRTRELRNQLILRGSRGTLIASKDEFDACVWNSKAGLTARLTPHRPFTGDWPATLVSCFAQKISDFLKALGEGGAPGVSARDAASTISIIEWAYSQHRKRGVRPVSLGTGAHPGLAPGRVVVTGGTGFIGSHLVGRLAQLGFEEILVPIRRVGSCAEVACYPVSLKTLNLLDAQQVRNAVDGARWVFHLAYGRDGADRDRITIEGTRNLVEAAIAARCECIVVLSTIYVFGDPEGVVDESRPYKPKGGRYGTEKAQMERWCLSRSASSSFTRVVILNPSCVFGPGGLTYSEMPHRMAKSGSFCWIEQGRGIANFCFVDNLVDAVLLAAGTAEAHGQRFIINDGTCTWREFLAPLVGGDPELWRSLTARKLADLDRAARPRWGDALRAIAADRRVREVLKTRMPTSAIIALARHLYPDIFVNSNPVTIQQFVSNASAPDHSLPPIWVSDLFGPAQTRFSAAHARSVLSWSPLVKLADAQDITKRWLEGGQLGVAQAATQHAGDTVRGVR
jgi:predicted dehydrogenase/nucleoside-diphosphate-sugar epimerase